MNCLRLLQLCVLLTVGLGFSPFKIPAYNTVQHKVPCKWKVPATVARQLKCQQSEVQQEAQSTATDKDELNDGGGSDDDSAAEDKNGGGHQNVTEPVVLTPLQAAILEKEVALEAELHSFENQLLLERQMLYNLENKISEGGKNAYYMVQAQVNDFKVRQNATHN